MTLSLYTQLVAAQAHAERLRKEDPTRRLTGNQQRALDALTEAGKPRSTVQLRELAGLSQRACLSALYDLEEKGLVQRHQLRQQLNLHNIWTVVDDAK